jgi:hypothetical protein
MNILTLENELYDIDFVPEEIDDLRYSVLDYSNKNDVDYTFQSLVFLEIFSAPAAVLQIGKNIIKVPLDWNIIVGDDNIVDPEIVPVSSLTTRGFKAFSFNPLSSVLPSYPEIKLVNIYKQMKWYSPKLKYGHFLTTPIQKSKNPDCVFFIKEITKIPEILNCKDLW